MFINIIILILLMKEIDIFEVKKGSKCGVIFLPRKYINKKVKVVLLEKGDLNRFEIELNALKRRRTEIQFKIDNIEELIEQRTNRKAIKNEKKMQSNNKST